MNGHIAIIRMDDATGQKWVILLREMETVKVKELCHFHFRLSFLGDEPLKDLLLQISFLEGSILQGSKQNVTKVVLL